MTRDPEQLLGADGLGDALQILWRAVEPRRAVGGWATVELERGVREVAEALAALEFGGDEAVPDDELLGARGRVLHFSERRDMLVLEPSTEGLLAAALARHGEGSLALYLVAGDEAPERARAAGLALSAEASGPLGPERRLLGGPPTGPHLLVVRDRGSSPAATIEG